MISERVPQCILGNGDCPQDCHLHDMSTEITSALGDNFDPQEFRREIVFADASNHDIRMTDVAAVMASCIKEGKPKADNQNPKTPRPIPQRPARQ